MSYNLQAEHYRNEQKTLSSKAITALVREIALCAEQYEQGLMNIFDFIDNTAINLAEINKHKDTFKKFNV